MFDGVELQTTDESLPICWTQGITTVV